MKLFLGLVILLTSLIVSAESNRCRLDKDQVLKIGCSTHCKYFYKAVIMDSLTVFINKNLGNYKFTGT